MELGGIEVKYSAGSKLDLRMREVNTGQFRERFKGLVEKAGK